MTIKFGRHRRNLTLRVLCLGTGHRQPGRELRCPPLRLGELHPQPRRLGGKRLDSLGIPPRVGLARPGGHQVSSPAGVDGRRRAIRRTSRLERRPGDRRGLDRHAGLPVDPLMSLGLRQGPLDRPHPAARGEDLALHRRDPLLGLGRPLFGRGQTRRERRFLQRPLVVLTPEPCSHLRNENRRTDRHVTVRQTLGARVPIRGDIAHSGPAHFRSLPVDPAVRHRWTGRRRVHAHGGQGTPCLLALATHRADEEHPGQQYTDDQCRRDKHQDLAGKVKHERSVSFPGAPGTPAILHKVSRRTKAIVTPGNGVSRREIQPAYSIIDRSLAGQVPSTAARLTGKVGHRACRTWWPTIAQPCFRRPVPTGQPAGNGCGPGVRRRHGSPRDVAREPRPHTSRIFKPYVDRTLSAAGRRSP